MTKAEEAALKAYPQKGDNVISQEGYRLMRSIYVDGYEAGYGQAEKDINKEMMDRMAEISEKQEKAALADLDYDIRFDPAMGFDSGSVSLYHGKDIIATSQVVDAEIVKDIHKLLRILSAPLPLPTEYKFGDKVKIVILRDETIND